MLNSKKRRRCPSAPFVRFLVASNNDQLLGGGFDNLK